MSEISGNGGRIDQPELWRVLQELEDAALEPTQCEELAALLHRSPAARRAYLEYFQQSAVLRMEAAKLHERGLLPLAGSADQTRRIFQRSVLAAAAVVALAATVAALIAVVRPEPARLAVVVAAETRWSIDGNVQDSVSGPVTVVEGSTVRVISGTLRLEMDSGDLMVLQGPARASFPSLHRPQLRHGWLWIDSKNSGKLFRVEAGGLRIRDIGTRFGVRVPMDDPVEVHLVAGRVQVHARDGNKHLGDLKEGGKAFAFAATGQGEELAMAMDPFPDLPELLAQPANYRTAVLAQTPVGYWALDDATGRPIANKIPESSTGFHGVAVRGGDPGPRPEDGFRGFSESNRALFLDGSSEHSVVADLDGLHGVRQREGAVSFWIRQPPGEIPRDEVLWLAGSGPETLNVPTEAILQTRLTRSGQIAFEVRTENGDVTLTSSGGIAEGRWHHVAASWGPSAVDLYLDGRLVARDVGQRITDDGHLRGRFVRFGKPSWLQRDRYGSFTGWVDEIALWDRPLTPVEAEVQYQSAIGFTVD